MEPTTRGHSSSLGPGILQKGNPGSAGLPQQHLHTEFKTTMLAQGRDYVQLKTRSAVLESDCLDFLFEGFQVQGC
jgi:hypothetical protein